MLRRRSLITLPLAMAGSALAVPSLVHSASRPAPSPSAKFIGLSLPLTGVQSSVGNEMREAYEISLNASGNPFKFKVLDDQSNADTCAENIKAFAADAGVIAASGIVGTPHALACAPIAASAGLPLVGIRSGARALRNGDNSIWHLRASFEEEITFMVRDAKGRGEGGMVVVYSDDAFGKSSRDFMLLEMKRLGVKEILTIAVDRDGKQVSEVCAKIRGSLSGLKDMPAIALLMITKPMIAATKELRLAHKLISPILAMSFTANTAVTSEQDTGLAGLGIITAYPLPRTNLSPASIQFRQEVTEAGKAHLVESLTAYEAWFYGKTLAALAGAETREQVSLRLSRLTTVAEITQPISFDGAKVGYRYLGMAYKSTTGKLRSV